jgi:hypothetical protein
MKYNECVLAWNPTWGSSQCEGTDQIRIGQLRLDAKVGESRLPDWLHHTRYLLKVGGVMSEVQKATSATELDLLMFIDFHTCVVRDGIPIEAAHREFLKIDSYRKRISPDIAGADE